MSRLEAQPTVYAVQRETCPPGCQCRNEDNPGQASSPGRPDMYNIESLAATVALAANDYEDYFGCPEVQRGMAMDDMRLAADLQAAVCKALAGSSSTAPSANTMHPGGSIAAMAKNFDRPART